MGTSRARGKIRSRILLAHKDREWVDQARSKLESLGYLVNDCYELDWVPDILGGSLPYDLALISNEIDPTGQASILDVLRKKGCPTKLILLLDDFDGSTLQVRKQTGLPTHRVSSGVDELAQLVVEQIGKAPDQSRM